VKALDTAISSSGIQVARQTCPVHLKRSRRVRVLLDLLLSLAVPTRVSPLLSYLLAPREIWPLLRSNNPTSPSTPSWRVLRVPLPLEDTPDRTGHSPQLQPLDLLSRSCNNITRTLIFS